MLLISSILTTQRGIKRDETSVEVEADCLKINILQNIDFKGVTELGNLSENLRNLTIKAGIQGLY